MKEKLFRALDKALEKKEASIMFEVSGLNLNEYEGRGVAMWDSILIEYNKTRGVNVTWKDVDSTSNKVWLYLN